MLQTSYNAEDSPHGLPHPTKNYLTQNITNVEKNVNRQRYICGCMFGHRGGISGHSKKREPHMQRLLNGKYIVHLMNQLKASADGGYCK